MDLSDKEKAIILDLAGFAWKQGGIRSPQQGQELQLLVQKLLPAQPEDTKDLESKTTEE